MTYTVYYNYSAIKTASQQAVSGTSYKVSGLPQNAYVEFKVGTASSGYVFYDYMYGGVTPSSVSQLAVASTFYGSKKLTIGWTEKTGLYYLLHNVGGSDSYYGYKVYIYNKSGKKIKTYTSSYASTYYTLACTKGTKMYKVVIKPFYVANSGTSYAKTYYGGAKTIYAVPQPNVKKTTYSKSKINLKWKKVAGAKKYTVYMARSKSSKSNAEVAQLSFKKIKTTKKTSLSIKKFKGKKINTKKYYYYIYIRTTAKVAGKSATTRTDSLTYYTYHRYY